MKRLLFAALCCCGALSASAAPDRVAEASSGLAPDAGDWVLFSLDDQALPWRENLKLTLERPVKFAGNPILGPGPEAGPDGYGALLYGTVIKEAGKFRMWYVASPRVDPKILGDDENMEYYRPVAYAESADGIHWTRPNLGLVDFRGNKNNNLIGIEPSNEGYARGYDFVAVLCDPSDPDRAQRYKMAYITHDMPRASGSTATAVSPDGLHWQLANTVMFTEGHFENTSLVKFDGLYYLAGQNHPAFDAGLADGSPAGRVMKVFFSGDFRHWSAGRALGFYRADYETAPLHQGEEVHMGAGLWNRGNVILGLYGRWHGHDIAAEPAPGEPRLQGLRIDLGLVVSNDAIHYREPVSNFVYVPHGAPGAWDALAVLQANAFANTATETYIWYTNWDTDRGAAPLVGDSLSPEQARKACGIGLLTLPRDRFGYLSKLAATAPKDPGQAREASCLSRSFNLSVAEQLSVNLSDVAPGAGLKIALVDDAERPLPGYTAELTAAALKAPVVWSGSTQALPVHAPFRIKLVWPAGVDRPKLYALYLEHL